MLSLYTFNTFREKKTTFKIYNAYNYNYNYNLKIKPATISGLSLVHPVSSGEEGMHQHHHQEDQDGRLVPALHAGSEHRLRHLQGGHPRAGQEAGLPQQGHL